MDIKTLRSAAKLAQLRATGEDWATIKRARKARRVESVAMLVRQYVSEDEISMIRRRGCLHVRDFPDKRKEGRGVRT